MLVHVFHKAIPGSSPVAENSNPKKDFFSDGM